MFSSELPRYSVDLLYYSVGPTGVGPTISKAYLVVVTGSRLQ